MIEIAGGHRLAGEAISQFLIAEFFQELDRDAPRDDRVAGKIDGAHPGCTRRCPELINTNGRRSMIDLTQFIIITHSRKTMEIANLLYRVTMEEPGVSKLISIQLN